MPSSPIPAPRPRPRSRQTLLVVPQVLNDSTTLLQKSLTSTKEDEETFHAVISSTINAKDKSAQGKVEKKKKKGEKEVEKLKGGLTLVTLDSERANAIAKTAVFSGDDEEDKMCDEKERMRVLQEDKSYSEWVSNKLYMMQYGFQKPASQQNHKHDKDNDDDDDDAAASITSTEAPYGDNGWANDVMNAVQELRLIHRPQTGNFLILVDQLRAMRRAAETLQSDDVTILSSALYRCERVFERHQRFDQMLETDPSKEEAIKALYELVNASSRDTIELIEDWSSVYHTLQELVLRIRTITTALVNNAGGSGLHAGGKSPKSGRRSLFGKKSSLAHANGSSAHLNNASTATLTGFGGQVQGGGARGVTPQFSPEVLRHQHEVCANWAAQMRTFEQLARAYRAFAAKVTTFSLIHEIDTVSKYYDQDIRAQFEKAQTIFLNSKMLSSLHDQIDYSNLFKTLNKEMALTTYEDRMSFPQFVPLFAKGLVGERRLVREGKLVEFVSATRAVEGGKEGSGKKKGVPTPAPPKEYRLIVTTDMIYMCEIVPPPSAGTTPHELSKSSSKKLLRSESKSAFKAANGSIVSLAAPFSSSSSATASSNVVHKPLRLCHEPVLVMDAQISSTPDVVHPPVIQKDMVMVCFYNDTTYILQAESGEVRDAWVDIARTLNIEQPKPSASCREQDDLFELQQTGGVFGASVSGGGSMASLNIFAGSGLFKSGGGSIATASASGGKTAKVSLLKRLKSLRRSASNLHAEDNGPIPEIHPDQLTQTDEEERARRMQLGQPSLWEVRRLPLDLGVIPPLEQPIPFRKRHLYDISVQIEDLTTGKWAPGEFGMGIEDRAAYFRDECALFAVLRPARLIPSHAIDRKRDDFFLCKKRMHKGEIHYVEPPYITDFYARSWLHPEMHIEFDPEARTVTIAKMYRITCSTTDIVGEFKKYHGWLMENARISPDNTFLCMDYRSKALRVSKRIERAASSAPPTISSVEDTRNLEGGRKYTELGECHMEFRRMSNAPDALSVGFYNPATKRDMAIGVMVFDKIKIKATASSLGLNALNALGATNGVVRVSPSEMSLTMWQTDARTRPRFIKGQRVFETVKSKSLDVFKLTGDRDALDELEEFIRVKMGTDCKARDIPETFRLIEIAFQDQVLDAPMVEEEEINIFETRRAQLQSSGSKSRSVRSGKSSSSMSTTTTPALSLLSKDNGRFCEDDKSVRSAKSAKSLKSIRSIKEEDESEVSSITEDDDDDEHYHECDEGDEFESSHLACEGYLATVLEEDEEEDSSPSHHNLSKKSSLASSTATFRPKSKKALQELLLQQELANTPRSTTGSALPEMDSSSFEYLSADGSLADYLSPTKSTSTHGGHCASDEEHEEDEEEIAAPTVADLTKFWAMTTNALVRSGSQSTIRSMDSTASSSSTLPNFHAAAAPSTSSTSSATTPPLNSLSSSTEKLPSLTSQPQKPHHQHQSEVIESSISSYVPPVGQPSELEARVLALKSTASHTAIVAQFAEENAARANVKDLVQATRYLPKYKIQLSAGFVRAEGSDGSMGGGGGELMVLEGEENEPGVDMENHMPVKDLKKRWEEIHRLGI
ncbi:hypothetical protein BGZ96_008005 [Linnemannia gamsii]|uniref:PH domain-containing protein n=1 Tax=Linnemannia gamsii TaxID=64522 RepID=A0ABQ7KFS0_9FUNG|nr:hypothetical protein BGZ96_008005 [Linnemannia gamsii]